MSKGKWPREKVTKIPISRYQGSGRQNEKYPGIDESYKNEKVSLDFNQFHGVNSENICIVLKNIAHHAGYADG